jgi:hypothetical protein
MTECVRSMSKTSPETEGCDESSDHVHAAMSLSVATAQSAKLMVKKNGFRPGSDPDEGVLSD